MKKIVIVGGGASGLVAAIKSKTNKNEVIILEKNNICGKKILATGAGRCNYYNDNQNLNNYYSHSIKKEEIINETTTTKVLEFFNELGIIPKIKNGYYYPMSNQATSIRNALVNKALELNIKIENDTMVNNIKKENNKFIVFYNNTKLEADKVVLATGSKASLNKNINIDVYDILRNLNLKVEKVLPSLVQLRGKDNYYKEWNGVRTDVSLKLYENDSFIKQEEGEIQLTDYGISGICTFNISGYVSRGLDNNKKEIVYIDFLPTIGNNKEELYLFLEARNKVIPNLNITSFLESLLNYKLVNTIIKLTGIEKDKRYQDLTKEEKINLVTLLKEFKFEVTNTNPISKAQTVTGGLSLEEINPKTMEVNKIKDLYVVGELLDVDGICGGYNLTFAWISGLLAGNSIKNSIKDK